MTHQLTTLEIARKTAKAQGSFSLRLCGFAPLRDKSIENSNGRE